MEITPALQEIIVAVSRKAVDDRIHEIAVTQQDFASLEAALGELANAQARSEKRLSRVETALERLAAAQARTEQRVEELAAAQVRTEERLTRTEERLTRVEAAIEQLTLAQTRTEESINELTRSQIQMNNSLSSLKGRMLELDYRDKAHAYFGRLLRRLRVIPLLSLEDQLLDQLPEKDWLDLLSLDLLLTGRPHKEPDAPDVWLAVEVSAVVDRRDVERAQRRAAALRHAGLRAIPTVAGEQVTARAEELAGEGHVLLLQNGRTAYWQEALADALAV